MATWSGAVQDQVLADQEISEIGQKRHKQIKKFWRGRANMYSHGRLLLPLEKGWAWGAPALRRQGERERGIAAAAGGFMPESGRCSWAGPCPEPPGRGSGRRIPGGMPWFAPLERERRRVG
jgi:hypothetical protein